MQRNKNNIQISSHKSKWQLNMKIWAVKTVRVFKLCREFCVLNLVPCFSVWMLIGYKIMEVNRVVQTFCAPASWLLYCLWKRVQHSKYLYPVCAQRFKADISRIRRSIIRSRRFDSEEVTITMWYKICRPAVWHLHTRVSKKHVFTYVPRCGKTLPFACVPIERYITLRMHTD